MLLLALVAACGSCKSSRQRRQPPPPPDQRVTTIEVTPEFSPLEVDQTLQLAARVLDKSGAVLAKTVTWASGNAAIATVSSSGLVRAVAAGTASISASTDGKTGAAQITVVPRNPNPVATVEVTPATASIVIGGSTALTAIAKDAAGAILNRTVTWASEAQSIATVSNTGVVAGVSAGTARITATVEGVSGSAMIEVRQIVMQDGDVNIVAGTPFQTMTGWEGVAQIGQAGCQSFNLYRAEVVDRLVNELGINRVRLEIRSGTEAPTDWFTDFLNGTGNWRDRWYSPTNDNGDPNAVDAGGFFFTELDHQVDNVVTPMQQAMAARGEQLYVSMCLVDFSNDSLYHDQPAELGELMAAAFDHLQDRYGWVPDGIEIILEPDNASNWSDAQVVGAIAGVGSRMAAEGYAPRITAPSTLNMWVGINWIDTIEASPSALQYVDEFSYHRYNGADALAAQRVGQRIRDLGIQSAMLEHINADIDELWEDLTVANNSAWQQFALAFCTSGGDAAQYYEIDEGNPTNPIVRLRAESRPFVQIFRHVRRGAVRHDVDVRDSSLASMAFRNASGKWVVIVRTDGAKTFTVGRLPPGAYGVDYTTDGALKTPLPDVTITGGETATLSIPARGLITIFGK